MTTRHDLPGGAWADFRDPAEVPERLRRPITKHAARLDATSLVAAAAGKIDPADLDAMFDLNDALVLALVASWSFDGVAVDGDGLGNLPGPAYDALLKLAAPSVIALMPDFGPNPAPDSPTAPSLVSV